LRYHDAVTLKPGTGEWMGHEWGTKEPWMYVLDALREPSADATAGVEFGEFRLLCSGILYNGNIETYDWTKSDVCRSLLRGRIVLFVVSRPMDRYPQELLLRVPAARVTEELPASGKVPKVVKMFSPHCEIADDLAALLTVLLRRLITVHSHVRTTPTEPVPSASGLPDFPLPIADVRPGVTWRPRGIRVLTQYDGKQEIDDCASAPVAVDANWLASILIAIPSMATAKTIVACARLYSEGMQLIEDRPEMAYQRFIAAAETLASEAVKDYSPTDDEKVDAKKKVYDRAIQLGLTQEGARDLAIEATRGMSWTSTKFQRCLRQYTDARLWQKDDLFITVEPFLPKEADFERALRDIYHSRSAALHTGQSFPASVGVGTSSQVSIDAMMAVFSGDRLLPPVTWFERVVQLALVSYIESQRAVPPP
jgi:hypothetical protein